MNRGLTQKLMLLAGLAGATALALTTIPMAPGAVRPATDVVRRQSVLRNEVSDRDEWSTELRLDAIVPTCEETFALSTEASAQSREPLCVTTEVRRLASAPFMQVNGSDYLVAQPLPSPGRDGAAFVVAVRDPDHSLRVGDARSLTRTIDEMEFRGPYRSPERDPGLTVMRLDRAMRLVGDAVFVPDPVRGERGEETFPPGIPAGVTVDDGVLVVEHIAGDLYATVIPSSGVSNA